ncbi:MAG: beta-ketoacyl-ACP synthase II [Actinomycetota bacterium]
MTHRVVITGIGPVTPIGIGVDDFWAGATSGRNGIGPITRFDASDLPVRISGEVHGFDPNDWLDPKEVRRTDRFVQLAMAAAKLAWADAGEPSVEPERGAILVGTGIGGIETLIENHRTMLERGPGRVSPFMVPGLMANGPGGHIAMWLKLTGPNFATVSACASGAHAVGEAFRMVRDGRVDLAIAGGSEAATLPICIAAFAQMGALTKEPDPERACRPFDAGRSGFVMAEGACVLVLETEERARARGASIYAEIAGYGASDDAYHITAPDPAGSGAALAIRAALADAGEPASAVDYVNAHGTSTPLNDAGETAALKTALGDAARTVAISSTKSMTGHLLGAAGAVEAAVSALAIREGLLPPTIHYETPDPECDLDYVPNVARRKDVRLALSNSFGFGGQNAVLALRRV